MKQVRKTYGHERGYSTVFRQWRAKSHCRFIHGYALSFEFLFQCHDHEVDENGWVIDFGGLKFLKAWLDSNFDHKFLVAEDDPMIDLFKAMNDPEVIPYLGEKVTQTQIVPAVGCEAFAELVYKQAKKMLIRGDLGQTKARLISVEVREHGANGAIYVGQ